MLFSRFIILVSGLLLSVQCALAQPLTSVVWPMLPDPAAQQFEDPYRDLTRPQFQSLMALARLRIALSDGDLSEAERSDLEERARTISRDLQAQDLDPEWILAQRGVVAERRQHAALSTNSTLEGERIELRGYLLVGADVEDGAIVAYLLPDRGVCMHLPPPAPNQLVRLVIDQPPEPLGPCIAAAVRGHLYANETTATVPVFEDTVPLWSSWQLDVSKATTSRNLPVEDNDVSDKVN